MYVRVTIVAIEKQYVLSSIHCACAVLFRHLWKSNFVWFSKKKYSNMKFHENPSSGSQVVPCGRTDRHVEADSRFLQFLRTRLMTGDYNWTSGCCFHIYRTWFKFFPKDMHLALLIFCEIHENRNQERWTFLIDVSEITFKPVPRNRTPFWK
jgi:hypothetical protein